MGVKEKIEKSGYKIVYVPHEIIEDYNACYRVKYRGKLIFPHAADKLGIPLNEIWISEKWKKYEEYIIYHELMEIKHRAEGQSVEQAHALAIKDAKEKYRGDPKHEHLRREINVAPKEILTELPGIDEDLYQKIKRNRPYHKMDELLEKIPSMEKKLFERIKDRFWCIS
jgi:competence protein ComEA